MPRMPTAFRSHPRPTEQEWASRRTAYRGEYGSPRWRKLRRIIGSTACWICARCSQPTGESGHCDHIVPARDVESFYDESNLQWLCWMCHSRKTVMEDGGFGHHGKRTVYVVTGLPGSGKTTWVRQHAIPGDLVWDVDAVASAVFGMPHYPRPPAIAEALASMRTMMLRSLPRLSGDAYVIESDPSKADALAASMGATVVRVKCDENERIRRMSERR